MTHIRKVVFPVAGLGTRMLPATKVLPKEMLPVVDKPIIQYAVEEAAAAGCETFIFVTGRGKTIIEDHFDRAVELFEALAAKGKDDVLGGLSADVPKPGTVIATRQQEAKGLGHAVWCARRMIGDEPFGVMLVDDLIHAETPCMAQMARAHAETGGNLVAVMEVPQEHTARYGIVDPGREDGPLVEVRGLVEKPAPEAAPSRYAVIGRYILDAAVFGHLDRHEVGAGGEIQLTDAMQQLIGSQPFFGYRFAGRRFDCGDKLGYLEAIVATALARPDLKAEFAALLDQYR
ncbi:MAG: UTP--glucose-1-phosphate uridylyltransferase GalU [Geminicoccaceae bacterium]